MERCCFYGSLRKGAYNYARFIDIYRQENMRYRRTITLPGFRLYELGENIQYPAAVRTHNEEDKIIVDLFDLSDTVFSGIYHMEKTAGYYEDLVCIDDEMHSIFLYESENIRLTNYIASGDWCTYYNNKSFVNSLKQLN